MDYTVRDLDTYKRKQHFKYFSGLAFPYVGTTAPVDITALMEKIRREGLPSFLTFCYCTLESAMPFAEYLPYAKREQERAKAARSIEEDAADTGDLLFISTLPWLSYTALVQPVPAPADSNPRITWGRFYAEGEKTLLPVSVLCNHALVDGLHIAAFYRRLEAEMAALCAQP